MKTRHGFVSNSSSSSFMVCIPEEFNVDELQNLQSDMNGFLQLCEELEFKSIVKKFINDKQ